MQQQQNNPRPLVSIDAGVTGCIILFKPENGQLHPVAFRDMPIRSIIKTKTRKDKKTGGLVKTKVNENQVDSKELGAIALKLKKLNAVVVVEKNRPLPNFNRYNKKTSGGEDPEKGKMSDTTSGHMMYNYGKLYSILELFGFMPYEIEPMSWKSRLGLANTKKKSSNGELITKTNSLELARQLWPDSSYFERAKDHNRADAALIGFYAYNNIPEIYGMIHNHN